MPAQPSDEEETYFKALEMEQRKQRRQELENNARTLEDRQAIASSVKTDDLTLANRIRTLGFDGDSARIFDLLPLVHVAWADGSVQKGERTAIFKVLESRGIERDSEAFRTMETLLEEHPGDKFMAQSLAALRELTSGISDRSEAIVDLCVEVAAASGGFLGIGRKIDDEERKLIGKIVNSLGSGAAQQFQNKMKS